jgi:hypothetical protein
MSLDDRYGISAMVRCANWIEDELAVEIMGIGRGCLDRPETHTLECVGRMLFVLDHVRWWLRLS